MDPVNKSDQQAVCTCKSSEINSCNPKSRTRQSYGLINLTSFFVIKSNCAQPHLTPSLEFNRAVYLCAPPPAKARSR